MMEGQMPWWAWTWPLAALVMFGTSVFVGLPDPLTMAAGVALIAAVFAAVYHAEIIAHRVGEPYGTLTLALAVTVIETALIVSLMLAAPGDKSDLARDTVFAAVMIICNGVVGLCLLFGGIRHREQGFQLESALAALAVLAALTVLTLVVPNLTTSTPGPVFATSQLAFAACASLVLYGSFLFFQTVSHREYFLLPDGGDEHVHAAPPSSSQTFLSLFVLIATLVAIVGLAKALSPTLETWVARIGAPKAVVGILVAALVLMPESLAAVRAARANRLQTSMNLALGSALATIGLTIPAVAILSIVLDQRLTLGLAAKEVVLLALTLLVAVITLGTGRTTVLQGVVHLVIFAAFLFLAVVP
jgi:Ca2+:H+ antiporter